MIMKMGKGMLLPYRKVLQILDSKQRLHYEMKSISNYGSKPDITHTRDK